MIENIEIEEIEQKEKFIIDDLSKAEWAVKKINGLQNEIETIKIEAKKMIDAEKFRVEKWANDEILRKQESVNFFMNILQPFAEQQLKDSKKKSFKVPSGTIGFKAGSVDFKIKGEDISNDNQDLIAFTQSSYPDLIKTETTVNWSDLKKKLKTIETKINTDDGEKIEIKVITEDGELVPDMTAAINENKFYVK